MCHQALIIFISNIFNFIPQNYTKFTQYLFSKHFHYMYRKKEILSAGLMKMQFKRYKRLLFNPTKFFLNHLLNFNQLRNYCIGVSEQARERQRNIKTSITDNNLRLLIFSLYLHIAHCCNAILILDYEAKLMNIYFKMKLLSNKRSLGKGNFFS